MGKVMERYYWVGVLDDVKEFCQTCDKCQRGNRYNITVVLDLLSIQYTGNLRRLQLNSTQSLCGMKYGTQLV